VCRRVLCVWVPMCVYAFGCRCVECVGADVWNVCLRLVLCMRGCMCVCLDCGGMFVGSVLCVCVRVSVCGCVSACSHAQNVCVQAGECLLLELPHERHAAAYCVVRERVRPGRRFRARFSHNGCCEWRRFRQLPSV